MNMPLATGTEAAVFMREFEKKNKLAKLHHIVLSTSLRKDQISAWLFEKQVFNDFRQKPLR
jgi:hypothetical protein